MFSSVFVWNINLCQWIMSLLNLSFILCIQLFKIVITHTKTTTNMMQILNSHQFSVEKLRGQYNTLWIFNPIQNTRKILVTLTLLWTTKYPLNKCYLTSIRIIHCPCCSYLLIVLIAHNMPPFKYCKIVINRDQIKRSWMHPNPNKKT